MLSPEGWQRLAELLAPALKLQCEQTAETICREIAKGESQAWGLIDSEGKVAGALVTHIGTFPSGLKCLTVTLAATLDSRLKWDSIRSGLATLEEFGRDYGCDVVRVNGRRGWEKVLPDYSFEDVTIQKVIGGAIQ